jgi:hypothetical protein
MAGVYCHSLKGKVPRDFPLKLFFKKHISLGPGLKPVPYGFGCIEIFKLKTLFRIVANNADHFSAVQQRRSYFCAVVHNAEKLLALWATTWKHT